MHRCLLLLGCCIAAPLLAGEAEPLGTPFAVRDQSLLGLAFLQMEPASARLLPPGEWHLALDLTANNTFARSAEVADALRGRSRGPLTLEQLRGIAPERSIFALDGEVYLTAIRLRRSFEGNFQLEIAVPMVTHRGGVLDGHIDVFHSAFSTDDGGRSSADRDSYHIYLRSRGKEIHLEGNQGTGLGNVVLSFQKGLPLLGPSSHASVRAGLKLPTGKEELLQSNGSPDFGLQFLAERRVGWLGIGGSLSVELLGAWDELGLEPQLSWSASIAAETPPGSSTTAILQLSVSKSPFGELGPKELHPPVLQGLLGVRRRFRSGATFTAAFIENLLFFDNSADIGLHVGFGRSF